MGLHPKQVITRQTLGQIANGTPGSQADDLLRAIDVELQPPLRLRVTGEYQITVDAMNVRSSLSDNRGNQTTTGGLSSQFKGYLDLTGDVFGAQLDNAQAGDYWIAKNSSNPTSIFATNAISLSDGQYLICNTTVAGTPTDGASFGRAQAGSDRVKSLSPINGKIPDHTTGTITIPSSSTGTVSHSTSGSTFDIDGGLGGWTSNNYVKLGIYMDTDGVFSFAIGTQNADPDLATIPSAPSGQFSIGHVLLKNSSGTVDKLANEHLTQYLGSGGGGGGLVPEFQNTSFTAEAGKFYLIDTSGGPVAVTLPDIVGSESVGFQKITDDTNKVTITADVSDNINGAAATQLAFEGSWKILRAQDLTTWYPTEANPGSDGTIMGPVETFVPSYDNTSGLTIGSSTSNAHNIGQCQRVGDCLHLKVNTFFNGDGTSVNPLRLNMPVYQGETITAVAGEYAAGQVAPQGQPFEWQIRLIPTAGGSDFEIVNNDNSSAFPLNGNAFGQDGGDIAMMNLTALIPINEWQNTGTTIRTSDLTAKTRIVDNSVLGMSVNSQSAFFHADAICHRDSTGRYWLNGTFYYQTTSALTDHTLNYGSFQNEGHVGSNSGGVMFASGLQSASVIQIQPGETSATCKFSAGVDIVRGQINMQIEKPDWFDANQENPVAMDLYLDTTNVDLGDNYFTNGDFTIDATTGVTATNVTSGDEITTPLFGNRSSKLTSQGLTGTVDYKIDGIDNHIIDGGFILNTSGRYKSDANAADGHWKIGVYNTTDSIYVTEQLDVRSDSTDRFELGFVPVSGKSYVLRVEFTDTTAGRVLLIDDLICNNKILPSSPIISDWVVDNNFVVRGTGSDPDMTNTFTERHLKWRRVGTMMEVQFTLEWTSAGSAGSGAYYLDIPGGYTANLASYASSTTGRGDNLGSMVGFEGGISYPGVMQYDNAIPGIVGFMLRTTPPSTFNGANVWGTGALGLSLSAGQVSGSFSIHIAEWAGSGITVTPNLKPAQTKLIPQSALGMTASAGAINGVTWARYSRDSDGNYFATFQGLLTGGGGGTTDYTLTAPWTHAPGADAGGVSAFSVNTAATDTVRAEQNNGNIIVSFTGGANDFYFGGHVRLASKPPLWDEYVEAVSVSTVIEEAGADRPGLLSYSDDQTKNLSSDPNRGGFTNGTFRVIREGNLVCVSIRNPSFPSNTEVTSAAGLIPEGMRPAERTRNAVWNRGGSNETITLRADADGTFSISWDSTARTSIPEGLTMTYPVA